jgi:hypothetical protein
MSDAPKLAAADMRKPRLVMAMVSSRYFGEV